MTPLHLGRTALAVIVVALSASTAHAEECGPLPSGGYGPYDYRTDRDKVALVEKFHFTPSIEALIPSGNGPVGAELDYVLDKFPNHHRALAAAVRMAERDKTFRLKGSVRVVECYFDRALRFRRDDTVVRSMFAHYLGQIGRTDDAIAQLDIGLGFASENALTHRNIGIVFAELKQYDRAVTQARKARDLGYPGTDLIDRLRAVGQWPADAVPGPATAASATPAASAP